MSAINPVAEHYVGIGSPQSRSVVVDEVKVRYSQSLSTDLATWTREGYNRIGSAEFVDRGNRMGVGHEAAVQAASVGASVVLFCATPAKVRAIRRTKKGNIEMKSVLDDPPASPSPRGYYVVRAIFLANHAQGA